MTVHRPIMAESPSISVIVPTIPSNDHDEVVKCLKHQSIDDFEVIIVDDDTMGVCAARNEGLKASKGDVVAFTDDDCCPPTEWLSTIQSHFESNPDLVCLEGPVEGGMEYEGYRKYPTCNLAVRRNPALSVGGFREEFEYWREDTEFGWRLEEVGDYEFASNVRMIHPPRARSSIVESNEKRLKSEYPEKYEDLIVPDTIVGKLNDWLWRNGFWDLVDEVRYNT